VPEVTRAAARLALALGLVACSHPRPTASPAPTATHRPTKPRPTKPRPAKPATPAAVPVAPDTAATVAPAPPDARPGVERGQAVWYASGRMTASGERFDKHKMAAAHRTLPFGTKVRVTADRTGRSVVVRINDRGPFGNKARIIDLTEAAAKQLGIIDAGHAAVTIEILESP